MATQRPYNNLEIKADHFGTRLHGVTQCDCNVTKMTKHSICRKSQPLVGLTLSPGLTEFYALGYSGHLPNAVGQGRTG